MKRPRQRRERYIDWHAAHGLWRVRPIVNGRQMKAAYFDASDFEEAVEYRDRIMAEAHHKDPTLPSSRTVAWLCERWLRNRALEVSDGQLAVNTYRDYERVIRIHIVPSELGRRRLRENLAPFVTDMLAEKATAGIAPSYRRRILVVLRQVLGLGVKEGVLAANYADRDHVRAPKQPKPRPDAWTPAEARQFLAASRESPMSTLWVFLLHTGARMGEALGLRWEDVDLDSAPSTVSFVQQRLRSKPGEPTFGPMKTERSTRHIPIDETLAGRLRAHKAATANLRAIGGTDLVFIGQTGKVLDATNVGRRWRQDVKSAGVRYLKPHGTRATHATIVAASGRPLEEVSRRLGHASAAFTADVYYKSRGSAALGPALSIEEALTEPAVLGSEIGSVTT